MLKPLIFLPIFCLVLFYDRILVLADTLDFNQQSDDSISTQNDEVLVGPTEGQSPVVMIAILARNKAHILPTFFGHLEQLNYPKKRIILWIASDHNEDNTQDMIREWLQVNKPLYHNVFLMFDETAPDGTPNLYLGGEWSNKQMSNVIVLRQQILDDAREFGVDYLMLCDADNIILEPDTLKHLLGHPYTLIAPLLTVPEQLFSNFWGAIAENGYYKRSDNYIDIVTRKILGVYEVPMIHSTFLVNMKDPLTAKLSYMPPDDYTGPVDDTIIFAHTAREAGIPLHVTNEENYGYLLPQVESLNEEREQWTYVKLLAISREDAPFVQSKHITVRKDLTTAGFDKVYVINLIRRPERLVKMEAMLLELGLEYELVIGYDGQLMNESYLESIGVKMLPTYLDPYHQRPLKYGEIGCFLSHYSIWLDVRDNNLNRVLVFEDDNKFGHSFRPGLDQVVKEADSLVPDWDLIYLGRKQVSGLNENPVDGSTRLVWPTYSYWTVSYALSHEGALKLLSQNPLTKMVAVDEYIPIMYNQHPNEEWKSHFHPRDLIAVSADPLLVEPAFYTGQGAYLTDTEDSAVIGGSDHTQETKHSGESESNEIPQSKVHLGSAAYSETHDEL